MTDKYPFTIVSVNTDGIEDERYGETYCIETTLIKGFKQVSFDANEYNAVLKEMKRSEDEAVENEPRTHSTT